MLVQKMKRCISFLLALVLIFSMVPSQVFATEDGGYDHGIDETIMQSKQFSITAE